MKNTYYLLLFGLVLGLGACKDPNDVPNPFDDPSIQPPDSTEVTVDFDPNSFEGIHFNVFRTTCANSGCHDGTFEPDFRSIESAYNTTVYAPIIKNDPQGSFEFRVVPGNPAASVLFHRLETDIDGQSGIMPLAVGPESDYRDKRDQYIENIRNWIQAGAPDINGNLPTPGNKLPQMLGVAGFQGGNLLDREPGLGPIKVAASSNSLRVWFAVEDEETALMALSENKVKVSTDLNDFGGVPQFNLTVVPSGGATAPAYLGDIIDYTHYFDLDISSYSAGTTLFLRIYVQDDGPTITEIPSAGSFNYIKDYAAIILE